MPFFWTTVLVPLHRRWRRIDLLSDSTAVGGDMPAGWLLLDVVPVSQSSYKQVSKQQVESMLNVENMDNFTALYTANLPFTFGTNSMNASSQALQDFCFCTGFLLQIYSIHAPGQRLPLGLSIMHRLLRPVRVQLRRTHAGVIWLPITLSGCVSSILGN